MHFMLIIHTSEQQWGAMSQEQQQQFITAYDQFAEAMANAGAMVAGTRLEDSAKATTVRVRNGSMQLTPGPYAALPDAFAGFFIITAKDMNEAVSWAANCPGAQLGAVEVRPVF